VRAVVLLALAACGDAVPVIPTLEATGGSRIKLEQYLYEDGTRQLDTRAFYDTRLHARCVPGIWGDGEQRCIPLASDAVYIDEACGTAVGIVRVTPEIDPAVFIGYDYVDGVGVPTRLFRAGDVIEFVPSHFYVRDGACFGPVSSPPEAVFLSTTAELPSSSIALVYDSDVGAGRLSVRMLATDDGLSVPVGVSDRELDVECSPALRDDGVSCEIANAPYAFAFAEPTCSDRAVTVPAFDLMPSVARTDRDACATSYHPLADEVFDAYWVRETSTGSCLRQELFGEERAFRLGAPVDIARLDHEIEAPPESRRLAHVTLADPTDLDVRYTSPLLVDRATRAECHRVFLDDIERCIPTATVESRLLYDSSCMIETRVAEIPSDSCTSIAFATGFSDDRTRYTIHAIGDEMGAPMYRLTGATSCSPYTPPSGVSLRRVGPALPAETFPAAFRFGER